MVQEPANVEVFRFCGCGHSEGAHALRRQGQCGFCHCQRFALDHVERRIHGEAVPESLSDARVGFRHVASDLGVDVRLLRDAARDGRLAAQKQAGRWTMRRTDAEALHAAVVSVPKARRARAQLSEALGAQDLLSRLQHRGRMISPPVRAGAPLQDEARTAERLAIEHQLHPDGLDDDLVAQLARARGRRQRARLAERRALDDYLHRPAKPAPRDRSI